jgi:ketosteroid isomerase-like protein
MSPRHIRRIRFVRCREQNRSPTAIAPAARDYRRLLAASRGGDFGALLALLDPDVVLRADPAAVRMGASKELGGAAAVAQTFSGRAQTAQTALVNGDVQAVRAPGGRPRVVFAFTITRGKIVEIEMLADPERLSGLDLAILDG